MEQQTKKQGEASKGAQLRKGAHVRLGRDRGVVTAVDESTVQVSWNDGKPATHHAPRELTPVE